jgi:protein gp37
MIEPVSHWGKGAPRRKSKSAVRSAIAMNCKARICDHCGNAQQSDQGNPNISSTFCTGCFQHNVTFHARRIFSLSLGDWLDPEVPIDWLGEMLDVIHACRNVTWILCTKRPENFSVRLRLAWKWLFHEGLLDTALWLDKWCNATDGCEQVPPPNVWLLTSVENQEQADKRIPELLKIPAVCRGLSLEPLLGPVTIWRRWIRENRAVIKNHLDWLIIGGESGKNARVCNVDWIRGLIRQGQAAGIATFVKQLGAKPIQDLSAVIPESDITDEDADPASIAAWEHHRHNCPLHLRDKKGGAVHEWPNGLIIRQFPAL